MKKLITVILILALIIPAAALADLPDISGLSNEELIELNHRIQLMLFTEKMVEGVEVPAGEYIVGEDMPAGVYRMEVVFPNAGGHMTVYDTDKSRTTIDQSYLGEFWGVLEIGKIKLEEGNVLRINGNSLRIFAYAGLFN